MSIAYKPEIDGLRAIAVSVVVLYHTGLGGSGFVGVDVFFVISGYLITALLLKEQASTGRIDLLSFYARRARRILPAVLLVIASTLAACHFLLPADAFTQAAQSAAASLLFLANIFFQTVTGGYFDADANQMPLLHLWSLSVEEQFYLLWPALLSVLLRFQPRRSVWAIAALGAVSFAWAQYLVADEPESAFYQMPARFWELAAGGLVAAMPPRELPKWLLAAGLALIGVSCLRVFGAFPALGALPVVLGSVLVVAAVHGGSRSSFLASRPMVGLGLVSYSLYLWHWPIFALYRATVVGPTEPMQLLKLALLALVLAVLTYRYVESPARRNRARAGSTVMVAVAALLCLSWGAYRWSTQPAMDDPFPLATRAQRDAPPRKCHSAATDAAALKCPRRPEARWGIWGDSMAYAWTPGVQKADPAAAVFTRDACGPYLGFVPPEDDKQAKICREHNLLVAEAMRGLDQVVMVGLWLPEQDRFAALSRSLDVVAPTVGRVLLIGPTPRMRDSVPRCLRSGNPSACSLSRAEFDRRDQQILGELNRVAARHPNVKVVDVGGLFCDRASCPPVLDGVPLYWDTHHVSSSKVARVDLRELAAP